MLFGPDPLGERLTLMWHNHFATSNLKVDDLALMRRQNETLRSLCRAPFGRLLHAMLRDPALLVWLDAPANPKGHPNENLARELMELFTLGIGHYSEDDVKEAARALTGWSRGRRGRGSFPSRHDAGTKTILGRTGAFDADALAAMLLEHPATSRRLAWRLCDEFFGEGAVDERRVDALAAGLRAHDLDIGWGVATMLRSRLFFAAANLGRRIAEPGRVRRRRGAGPRDARPAAEHAGAGRLVRAAGPGPVLSAQRRRLAGRPVLAHDPLDDRPGELRRGPGRRPISRPAGRRRRACPGRPAMASGGTRRSSRNCSARCRIGRDGRRSIAGRRPGMHLRPTAWPHPRPS